MIYFLLTLLAIVLLFVAFSNYESNKKHGCMIGCALITIASVCNWVESYLDKASILQQVGYVSISKEEMMDLTPNELKQFIEVNGVYFKVAETE